MRTALLMILSAMLLCTTALAKDKGDVCDSFLGSIMNECVEHPQQMNDHERLDYGLYLHAIVWESESKDVEVGVFNTYEHERNEFTSLLGAKVYFNRLFWQKEE
jgi:hypothetical protein